MPCPSSAAPTTTNRPASGTPERYTLLRTIWSQIVECNYYRATPRRAGALILRYRLPEQRNPAILDTIVRIDHNDRVEPVILLSEGEL